MAKRARAGELRTLVYFRRAVRRVDGEGYPLTEREEPDSRDFDKARYSGCDGPIRSLLTR